MSVTAVDLLSCAQTIVDSAPTIEGNCRAAVSRAYYAAYHDTDQWHANLPVPGYLPANFPKGKHAQLCERLASPDTTLPAEQKMLSKRRGYALKALHSQRIQADYYLNENFDAFDSRQAISDASVIIGIV